MARLGRSQLLKPQVRRGRGIVEAAVTQAAYRFYADGTESGSTALAAQNTAYTANVTAGDINLQLRTLMQSTTTTTIASTSDWQLQWEKNANSTWVNVAADSTGPTLIAEYPSTSLNTTTQMSSAVGSTNAVGMSFVGNGGILTKAGFWLSKIGSPDNDVFAWLTGHNGSYGASSGIGTEYNESNYIPCSTLSSTPGWVYFDFTDNTTLVNGTPYFIFIGTSNAAVSGNWVVVGANSAGTWPGEQAYVTDDYYMSAAGMDSAFRVYTGSGGPSTDPVVYFNSSNLTDSAATTNRLTGGTGTFTAGEVSEDGLVDDLGWPGNNYTELLYSIALKQSNLANADILRFRVLRDGLTTGMTYSVTPTLNVTKGAVATGRPKYYNGSAFQQKPMKYFNGSIWQEKPVKEYTGSGWETLT